MTNKRTRYAPVRRGALELERGEIVTLHHAAGVDLQVAAGCVWITQERDRRDLLIFAGRRIRLQSDGKTVVSAYRGARIALLPGAGAGTSPRIERRPVVAQRDRRRGWGVWLRELAERCTALGGLASGW